jgi:hypothetical protein
VDHEFDRAQGSEQRKDEDVSLSLYQVTVIALMAVVLGGLVGSLDHAAAAESQQGDTATLGSRTGCRLKARYDV